MQYRIEIEWAGDNFSAYSPDVPGCVAVGDTRDEVRQNMASAIAAHLEVMRESGLEIPIPEVVEVPLPA